MATQKTEPRDWRAEMNRGHVAHFDDASGKWDGPEDAFVWRGLPVEGFPYSDQKLDEFENKWKKVPHYFDETRVSKEIGGVTVKWIAWDAETSCNVYQRVA
jgi:hypothetical protein